MRSRWLLVLLAVLSLAWLMHEPDPARGGANTVVFPLKVGGTAWQPDITFPPGKFGIAKITDKEVTQVLQGTLPDFATDYLDLDQSGRFFLFVDSRNQWRVATNPNGDGASTLQGQTAPDGTAWMFGEYDLPLVAENAKVFMTGKVKFAKNEYIPLAVKGTLFFSSGGVNTGLIIKFKTLKPAV